MATIRKRGTSYQVNIRRVGHAPITKTFSTKAEASAWGYETEKDILSNKYAGIPNKTFGDLLDRYSKEVSPTKRGKRWEQIRIKLFKTYPLAEVNLRELSTSDFATWRDTRLSQVSPASVRREWNILSNACKTAVIEWKWMNENYLAQIKRPPPTRPRDRLITDDEITKMCHSAGYSDDAILDTKTKRVAAAMLFAIETGMRLKEITRLTWDRVYVDKQYIHVNDDSKTGRRDVPVSTKAINIITYLRCVRDGDMVFQLSESQVDSLFRKLKSMAQCEGFTFHDTKHLACTRLAQKLSVFDLARMVGTRDLKTLMIYYNPSASDIADKLD